MKIKFLIICILLTSNFIFSQERETRAVWVTTNFKLDWPPNTKDELKQKQKLKEIFEDLSKKHFNTVYFQVRSNGTVLYNSDIEPFSPYITGVVGGKPNYDPLQYAIDLGREYDLEVHAWINMIRCYSGADDSFLKHPKHVRNAHPDWTVRVMDENGKLSYWLNPGYYKAQDYLVDLMVELTNKYDVDGIHLDFFRYPGNDFDDDKYFKNYGFKTSIDDWRRNNLTTILRKFKERAKPLNKFLKVGATPIGIRKNLEGAVGWEGYSSVYQDTETWLQEELVDYLTPQIYWDFENNPRFDVLAKDWVGKSNNKLIVLGLAAYKEDIKIELNKMIDFSREINSAGISFFRYANIASVESKYFDNLSLPPDMIWKSNYSNPNFGEIHSNFETDLNDEITIVWNDQNSIKNNFYRKYLLLNETKPLKLLGLDQNYIKLRFGSPSKLMYEYNIGKIDRLWNVASISNTMPISVPFLVELKNSGFVSSSPILYKENEEQIYLAITSNSIQKAIIDFITIENIGNQNHYDLNVGLNIIPIKENLRIVKKLRITYSESKKQEEINLF